MKIKNFIRIAICTLLSLPFGEGWGGIAQTLNLGKFGIEEGLPQSSIYTMLEDKNGIIWVGTMNGVSKYNGLNFENFNKKDGLAENRVTSSCLDKNGDIWFGHWSGGITRYNTVTKKFSELIPSTIKISKTITCILSDSKGIIWIGTDGQGLLKYEKNFFTAFTIKDGLTSNIVSSLMENIDGAIWIGTANGISIAKIKLSSFATSFPSKSITSLLHDSKGNVWIGTSDYGVVRINASDKFMKDYTTSQGLASNHVTTVFESDDGTIFIGTYDGGVSKYLPQLEANNYKGAAFQTISTQHGLSNNRVLSIIQDREKNIWIGTFLNLNQYFDEQFEIYGENEGLQNSLVWSIIEGSNNDFWIGTEGGLVQFIPDPLPKGERTNALASTKTSSPAERELKGETSYRFIRHTGKKGQSLNTTALYKDIKGFIWFSDFGQGVSRLNPATGTIKHYTMETGLPVNEIYCINGDKDGNIWIGTNKGGLLKFDISKETFERFTTDDGLGSNQIYTIFRDSKNRMWFGSLSGDLTMHDSNTEPLSPNSSWRGAGGEPERVKGKGVFKTFSGKDGYPSKFTICITEDSKGNLWFGTYDMGIYKYDPLALLETGGHLFRNYSTKDGLDSNTPFLLVCDHKNNLWIGSGLGIDKFNLRDETFKHYEKEDGFLGVEINPNAVCQDRVGNLWFGSIIGLVKYNSKLEKNNLIEPVTTIKNPRLFFQNVEIPENHIFPWTQNHFTFDFVGTSLTNPKRVKYRYMLEGLDKDWSPIVKENSITYPNLSSGSYTFKVRSCNNDGVWNNEPITFQFVINPPFWKTTWFYIFIGMIVFSGIIFFTKLRERVLRKENIILEKKVTERTEVIENQKIEILQMKDAVEKKNIAITDSIEYASIIQQAILPSEAEINEQFKNHFILYKPKDIVSGDFYWIHEETNRTLFAVADCTGHGVSGAFVSLMGHNLLNETINENHNYNPSEILFELNNKILNTLKQNSQKTSAKYGMDIALISVDKKTGTLEYAGAHNPLLIFRGNSTNEKHSECFQIKANQRSIGTYKKEGDSGFANHTFQLIKGDMLYMFSDGYADQIGGPEDKRIFSQAFHDILQSICQNEMVEQKKILDKTIIKWKGTQNQTDDILVVGIRI